MSSHETKPKFQYISLFLTCACILGAINASDEYDPRREKEWQVTEGVRQEARMMASATYDVCMRLCSEPFATPCYRCEHEAKSQYLFTLGHTDGSLLDGPYSDKTPGWVIGAIFFGFIFYRLHEDFLSSRRKYEAIVLTIYEEGNKKESHITLQDALHLLSTEEYKFRKENDRFLYELIVNSKKTFISAPTEIHKRLNPWK